eukprot:6487914-Lingulodinium_polyedra.AAC.1
MWTAERQVALGYVVEDELCALCRAEPDTVGRRLLRCPALAEQRARIANDDDIRALETLGADHPACKGW